MPTRVRLSLPLAHSRGQVSAVSDLYAASVRYTPFFTGTSEGVVTRLAHRAAGTGFGHLEAVAAEIVRSSYGGHI